MKLVSANLEDLRQLYLDQLKQLHSAEAQITDTLPKLIEIAREPELKSALQAHLQETRGHVTRLEEILQQSRGSSASKKSKGMAALLTEGEDAIKDANDPAVKDATLIAAAQKVEHYEIAAYGTVRNYAQILGEDRDAQLLQQTLDEEKHADSVLTQIADSANPKARRAA